MQITKQRECIQSQQLRFSESPLALLNVAFSVHRTRNCARGGRQRLQRASGSKWKIYVAEMQATCESLK